MASGDMGMGEALGKLRVPQCRINSPCHKNVLDIRQFSVRQCEVRV